MGLSSSTPAASGAAPNTDATGGPLYAIDAFTAVDLKLDIPCTFTIAGPKGQDVTAMYADLKKAVGLVRKKCESDVKFDITKCVRFGVTIEDQHGVKRGIMMDMSIPRPDHLVNAVVMVLMQSVQMQYTEAKTATVSVGLTSDIGRKTYFSDGKESTVVALKREMKVDTITVHKELVVEYATQYNRLVEEKEKCPMITILAMGMNEEKGLLSEKITHFTVSLYRKAPCARIPTVLEFAAAEIAEKFEASGRKVLELYFIKGEMK